MHKMWWFLQVGGKKLVDSGGSGERWGSLVREIGGVEGRLKLVGFEVKVGGVGVLRRKRLW